MNRVPKVSVILIIFNEERFLSEAVASVLAQTYSDWELLLLDDGSTDRSAALAREYERQDPERIRYLEHEGHQNQGMSATRNLGIRHARSEYISFIDADDVWLPRKLEVQLNLLEAHPEAGLVCGPAQWWYSWTGDPEDIQRDFVQQLGVQLNSVVKAPALLLLFLQDEWASLCDILVRREIVEAVGGYEESFRGMYEDQAFHAKLCLRSPAFVSSTCWYRYRQHPESCTSLSHHRGQTHSARRTFLRWLEDYCAKHAVKDPAVWRVLRKEVWLFHHPNLSRTPERLQRPMKSIQDLSKLLARYLSFIPIRHWLQTQRHSRAYWPPVGWVRFGSLRRVTPISREFGFDRGLPIDRYYIEQFLSARASDIQGRVLEIGDDTYTRQFGGDLVTRSDVLHVIEGNPKATIVGDLTCADHIPSDVFDCVILTQTLQLIYDVHAVIQTLYRILKPGGVVLVTLPGITQISHSTVWSESWYWSFTTLSAQRLFEEVFPRAQVWVESHGNVLAAIAFLSGLGKQELRQKELDYRDPDYDLVITVRAMKPEIRP